MFIATWRSFKKLTCRDWLWRPLHGKLAHASAIPPAPAIATQVTNGGATTDFSEQVEGGRMLHWLWTAIIGLVIGAVAKLIMPGKDPGGIFITMLLGIAGSLLAGWLGRAVGWYQEGQSAGFIMSVIGAIILLAIYRLFKKSTA
jgi:uncharacterized membrane protein YeaQ/YmgE (transglycosylase-associated protein family)